MTSTTASSRPAGPTNRTMAPTMYQVVSNRPEGADTATLTLEPLAKAIEVPQPGQFTMLWAFGVGEAPISVASVAPAERREGAATDPHDPDESSRSPHRLVHTIRAVGPVTDRLCRAAVGEQIGVRGPFGTGWDLERALDRDVLVVAGGLGTAPVRPIVEHVLARREQFGRLVMLIGARSPEAVLYRPLLERWRSRLDAEVEVTVDTADPSWRGDVGLVTRLIDRAPVDFATTAAYVCGPEIMMRFVAAALVDRGTPSSEISVSLERNMHCAIGHCGHCQLGPLFLCKDGPVVSWAEAQTLLAVRER